MSRHISSWRLVHCCALLIAAWLVGCTSTRLSDDAGGCWRAVALNGDLPRTGRWRGGFELADVDADGEAEVVLPPPRKTLRPPVILERTAQGWRERPLEWPVGRYDYGGVTVGDFNGDGQRDLVLASHLLGFTGLLAESSKAFRLDARGLPTLRNASLAGSGTAVATLPAGRHGEVDRALLLLEPRPRYGRGGVISAPGLASYRWSRSGWRLDAVLDEGASGHGLSLGPADRCQTRIAYVPARTEVSPLLSRKIDGHWHRESLDEEFGGGTATRWLVRAAALGDWNGDGCADLAAAVRRFGKGGREWLLGVVYLTPEGPAEWLRIDEADGEEIAALAFAHGSDGRPVLAASTGTGQILLFGRDNQGKARLDEVIESPDWRAGCGGTGLRFLSVEDGGLELYATFAGGPSLHTPGRCHHGGAIAAWRVVTEG